MTVQSSEQDLRRSLSHDFFLSFRHSQGSMSLQRELFSQMAGYYKSVIGDDVLDLVAPGADWMAFDRLPAGHHHVMGIHSESASVADDFRLTIFSEFSGDPNTAREYRGNGVQSLFHHIIRRDGVFQERSRRVGSDPHASYFRSHVLLGQSTGREVFDDVYGNVRDCLPRLAGASDVPKLAAAWESNHQGESFDPADLLSTLQPGYGQGQVISA